MRVTSVWWRLCALLLLSVVWSASGLVFDPIAPSIVSVSSPACTQVEANGTRTASQCPAGLAGVLFQLKGTDWNGVLEIPFLALVTPLNVGYYMSCQQDDDWGVVTVGHEAWEVSCMLPSFYDLPWYAQQGAMGLQITDPPFTDPSATFYGITTSAPPQSIALPVLFSIVGCTLDCRPSDVVTITGMNFDGAPVIVGYTRNSWQTGDYNLTLLSASSTQLVAQLPAQSAIAAADLDAYWSFQVIAGGQYSINYAQLAVESPRVYPVVLGVRGCAFDDQRRRTTSGCQEGQDSLLIEARGWSSDLTGVAVALISPIGNQYACDSADYRPLGDTDSFDVLCSLPSVSASETYAMWQVAIFDEQNGLSLPYLGFSYEPASIFISMPLVNRIYCVSGCYSGDVLAIEGQQLYESTVTLVSSSSGYEYDCPSYASSSTRITCVLPYVPDTDAGTSLDMAVQVSNMFGMGEEGRVTIRTSPPLPRITAIYPNGPSCTARSRLSLQGCRVSSRILVRSEGWSTDADDYQSQVILVTSIGREVACGWWSSNFSISTGVMFTECALPRLSWQETLLDHSMAITAPDSSDTWYWSDAVTGAVQYNTTAPPSSALSLPAAYGVALNCPQVNNVSYCTSDHSMTVSGARLTDPVTAVLGGMYAVLCDQLEAGSVILCPLPSIKAVDVGLVLEVDIYTTAGQAPTAYPPILAYAASAPYEPSGVPIPVFGSSTAAPRVPSSSSSSAPRAASSSSSARRVSSSSSSSSARRSVTSSSSSLTSSRPPSRSSSSSSTGPRGGTSTTAVPVKSTAAAPSSTAASRSSTAPSRSSSSAATARPSLTSSLSSSASRRSSSAPVPVTSAPTPSSRSSSSSSRGTSSSSSTGDSSTGSGSSDSASNESGGMSGGAVAGIVVLVLLLVVGGVAGGCCWKYGCPSVLRFRRSSGPRTVDELLNMPDGSMDGEGAGGYVPPNYATNAAGGAFSGAAAASYQPPNAHSSHSSHSSTYSNPYLPPSMHSAMLPSSRAASDYVPPNSSSARPSIFNHHSTVHGSVDATDGYGHTSDDY